MLVVMRKFAVPLTILYYLENYRKKPSYQFEPEFSSSEEGAEEGELEELEHQDEDENARTRNSDW